MIHHCQNFLTLADQQNIHFLLHIVSVTIRLTVLYLPKNRCFDAKESVHALNTLYLENILIQIHVHSDNYFEKVVTGLTNLTWKTNVVFVHQ